MALVLAAIVLAAAAAGLISLWLHPWRPCRACGGSGKTRDRIRRSAHGTCPSCGGRGRRPSFAIRIVAPARYRRLAAERPDHKSVDQRKG